MLHPPHLNNEHYFGLLQGDALKINKARMICMFYKKMAPHAYFNDCISSFFNIWVRKPWYVVNERIWSDVCTLASVLTVSDVASSSAHLP